MGFDAPELTPDVETVAGFRADGSGRIARSAYAERVVSTPKDAAGATRHASARRVVARRFTLSARDRRGHLEAPTSC